MVADKILEGINLTLIRTLENREMYLLREANFYVREKEIAIIEGAQDSGKTALLNVLSGFEKLKRGEVVVAGQSLAELKSDEKLKIWRLRFVSQVSEKLDFISDASVFLNVELPLLLLKIPKKRRYRQVTYALEAVGLIEQAKVKADELSLIQVFALCCARALASDPAVILIDDPLTNIQKKILTPKQNGIVELIDKNLIIETTNEILHTLKQLERTVIITSREGIRYKPRDRIYRHLYGKLIKAD